jgi:hypothetical protein
VCLISASKEWRQDAKVMASGGAGGDVFGYSTAIAGNAAFVGAYQAKVGSNNAQGAAYMFRSSDGGRTWPSTETQKLTASDGDPYDNFGHSSAIFDDVFLVGAHGIDFGPNSNQGAAYIFRSSNGGVTWPSSETQKLTASDGATNDAFGWSTAISGAVALVGAYGFNSSRGAAYIFRSSNGGVTWPSSETQKLTVSDGASSDKFGYSSAISGDVALVGASGFNGDRGAAYIFRSSDGGVTWPSNETQKLTAVLSNTIDYFGSATAISGDVALVGAYGVQGDRGAAYIFRSSDGGVTWPSSETQKLTALVGATNDKFGISTAISGGVALVGASGTNPNQGAAYIFRSSDGGVTWPSSETQKITASDSAGSNYFGRSTAISGDVALVGAYGVNLNQGAAYIFEYPTAPSSTSSGTVASDDIAACACT